MPPADARERSITLHAEGSDGGPPYRTELVLALFLKLVGVQTGEILSGDLGL